MPGRTFMAEQYRYGYQGSERDPEMLGGAGYTTFFRALDPRIGRWLTPDPKVFPWQSPYVSMDGNPVALVDVWGASTDGGEKGGAQKHADKYKAETGRSYSTDPSDGYVFEGVDVSAPGSNARTPSNFAFANDATFVSQAVMQNIQGYQSIQVTNEYEQNLSFLNRVGIFFRELENNLTGNGSYTNWDVSGGWQIYNPDGGGFGAAIHGRGNPELVDVNTIPFQLGVSGGFRGNRRIGYIGRKNPKSWVLFGKDVSKISQLGYKSINAGSQITAATEAVVGKGSEGNKPMVRGATGKRATNIAKKGTQDLMNTKYVPKQESFASIYYLIDDSAHILTSDEARSSADHDTCWVIRTVVDGVVEKEFFTNNIDTVTIDYEVQE